MLPLAPLKLDILRRPKELEKSPNVFWHYFSNVKNIRKIWFFMIEKFNGSSFLMIEEFDDPDGKGIAVKKVS